MAEDAGNDVTEAGGKKKRGKLKKFFVFALFATAATAIVKFFKGKRGADDENEWQELPPPAGS